MVVSAQLLLLLVKMDVQPQLLAKTEHRQLLLFARKGHALLRPSHYARTEHAQLANAILSQWNKTANVLQEFVVSIPTERVNRLYILCQLTFLILQLCQSTVRVLLPRRMFLFLPNQQSALDSQFAILQFLAVLLISSLLLKQPAPQAIEAIDNLTPMFINFNSIFKILIYISI